MVGVMVGVLASGGGGSEAGQLSTEAAKRLRINQGHTFADGHFQTVRWD